MEHWQKVQEQRKIDADVINYRRNRFEQYWQLGELGVMTRLEILEKLQNEEENE
jgi:hypothetical protein